MKHYKYNQEKMRYEEINKHKAVFPLMLVLITLTIVFFSTDDAAIPVAKKTAVVNMTMKKPTIVKQEAVEIVKQEETRFIFVSGTYYHSDPSQGEGDGSVTADGSKIDINLLDSGQIRWVALSRDLLKQWGGKFKFGDKIMVEHEDDRVAGIWIVKDCMNARFTNKIDFLIPKGKEFCGKIRNIKLTKA